MAKKIFKIGIYGSASGDMERGKRQAVLIGNILAKHKCTIITGASTGLPYLAAKAANTKGRKVWGFSPEYDLAGQKLSLPEDDSSIYNKLIYTPKSFPFKHLNMRRKYRNVISTATCDAGIIIAGRWGTLHEVASLYDFGKVIGVLEGTGGIADELKKLHKKIYKPSGAKLIFSKSPKTLIQKVFAELNKRNS